MTTPEQPTAQLCVPTAPSCIPADPEYSRGRAAKLGGSRSAGTSDGVSLRASSASASLMGRQDGFITTECTYAGDELACECTGSEGYRAGSLHRNDDHTTCWREPGFLVVSPRSAGYNYQEIATQSRGLRPPVASTVAALHTTDIQVYTPHSVGGKLSWQILLNSQQLTEVLPGLACAAEVPDSPMRRATIARKAVPSGYALVSEAARWIHWGGTPPEQLDIAYNRFQTRPANRYIRSVRKDIYPKDLMTLAGVLMTTVERTALDTAAAH